jgi:hypothetical protein
MSIKQEIKAGWEAFLATVKASPAAFAYGIGIGFVAGAILF